MFFFFCLCKLNRCVSSTKGKNRHIRMGKIEKKGEAIGRDAKHKRKLMASDDRPTSTRVRRGG